jgi:hypothetical protein
VKELLAFRHILCVIKKQLGSMPGECRAPAQELVDERRERNPGATYASGREPFAAPQIRDRFPNHQRRVRLPK